MKALIRLMFDGSITTVNSVGTGAVPPAPLSPQMIADEIGVIQMTVSQDISAPAPVGSMDLEGRLDPSQGWALIATFDYTDKFGEGQLVALITGVQMMEYMRCATRLNDPGTYTVLAGTTAKVHMME